jgi:catechol 2,3-dioxygenase-like lactoylglutathione lyase family enzyme
MTVMDITVHASFLPHNGPDASLAFYRDTLGFEGRDDVGYDGMRWITVGPAGQPGTSIVLEPPAADPGVADDERRTIVELAGHSDRDDAERDGKRASLFMAEARRPLWGSLASLVLATVDSLSSLEVKRLGLVRCTEVLRNG